MTAKEFALNAIAPYYKNPEICGFNTTTGSCKYSTEDGRKCVFGKYIRPEIFDTAMEGETANSILRNYDDERTLLIPEAVDMLSNYEWMHLQDLHDTIAQNHFAKDDYADTIEDKIDTLGLFTLEELENKIQHETV